MFRKVNRKNNKHNNNSTVPNINLSNMYSNLKQALNERARLQDKQKVLWSYAKQHRDVSKEMNAVDNAIGKCTHTINNFINQLSHVKINHKAMNMAHNYLNSEIERTKKIINKFENLVHLVKQGKKIFVNEYGVTHTNPREALDYIEKKNKDLQRLISWDKHISQYLK